MITIVAISILVSLFLFAALLASFVYYSRRKLTEDTRSRAERFEEIIQTLDNRLHHFQQQMESRLKDHQDLLFHSQEHIGKRLDGASHVIGQVQTRLGQLDEANKRIYEVGKDIRGLEEILKAPKQRGVLGELFLGDLLTQVLPRDRFQLQYSFRSNEKVDAVICLAQGLVPIDAKFPLENFKRYWQAQTESDKEDAYRSLVYDTKKHIDAVAAKYIVPDEGTLEFALMYIPAENVFYELAISDYRIAGQQSLIEYALHRHVIPVSPNTLYAYLQTVLLGLRGLRIEESARHIQELIARLRLDFAKLNDDLSKLGQHLRNASHSHEQVSKRFERIHGKLATVTDSNPNPEEGGKQQIGTPEISVEL